MAFFAIDRVLQSLSVWGAWFHIFAALLVKLSLAKLVLPSSFHNLVVYGLTILSLGIRFSWFFSSCIGYLVILQAFHASISLMLAASWFTESMSVFFTRSMVCVLSARVQLLRSLSILFCATWVACIKELWLSSSLSLTILHSCRPYLSLEVQSACANLGSFFAGM